MRLAAALLPLLLLIVALTGVATAPPPVDAARLLADGAAPLLADYRLFADAGARTPRKGVTGYTLNTALFSDYAAKHRYAFIPAGAVAAYRDAGHVLDFPVGSVLVKTFAFPQLGGGERFIETRLLIRKASGWVPNTYVWNAAQTEARLLRTGTRVAVQSEGRAIDYAVPNVNQCKQCHLQGDAVTPIGPTPRNLNGGAPNQVDAWSATKRLTGAPPATALAALPRWDDVRAPVADRARAYLDVNCAHCHSRAGFAGNSGLYLGFDETDPAALGIGKRPIAAGRGSGGLDFAIAPGAPARSILIHRMASTEPGVMMPQFGRTTTHAEGVALIEAWIAALPPGPAAR